MAECGILKGGKRESSLRPAAARGPGENGGDFWQYSLRWPDRLQNDGVHQNYHDFLEIYLKPLITCKSILKRFY